MSKRRIAFGGALALAAAALACGPASAHHSFAMFDDQVTLTIPGAVQTWQWTNPHSWLEVVADADGKHWSLEAASPSMLVRTGLTRKSFKAGDKVTVKMHPLRDKSAGGELVSVELADGQTLMFRAGGPGAGPRPGGGPPE
jgi:hypothetical protein